jgi:regulator of cell morphogenesis and NO signaling
MSARTPSTIEHLAESNLAAERLLVRLGIDPIAQAERSLEEACLAQGLDPVLAAQQLAALKPMPRKDWTKASQQELVHHIIHVHHAWTREELVRIQALLDAEPAGNGLESQILPRIKVHFAELAQDLVAHFQMEERNLFPAICAAENGGPTPISLSTPSEQARTITAEHQAVEELFHNLRILTGDYEVPPDAGPGLRAICLGLRNLEDDLHVHLYLENHVLFPRALPR